MALPTASFAVAMVAAVADQNPESPSASSVAKVEEPEPFQFHQRVVEIFQCFLCVAAAPKEPVLNPLKVPLSVSGDDNRAGDKGTDDKPGNISPSETLDILGD